MRLYYIAEGEGRRYHVRSALGVNAERWNDFLREFRDWRLRLRDRYGIAPGVELQPLRLLDAGDPPSGEGPSMACMSREEAGGAQHRAEAAALLTELGHSPGQLDYMEFLEERDAALPAHPPS